LSENKFGKDLYHSKIVQVKDIGEQGLLQRLKRYCPQEIIGDDGAVINVDSQQRLVITTDMLVDEVHFSDRTTAPEDVGWRSAAANLSDLAAMGASPIGITVSLGLIGDLAIEWVERLYQGLSQCLQTYQTPLVGGDVCRSPIITISITAFGQVSPQQVICRRTAQPGDTILITGVHGASRAGLELLWHPQQGQTLSENEKNSLIQAHQRPKPRLDIIKKIREIMPTARISGMDSSDGLADAVIQTCRESEVGATLEESAIPRSAWHQVSPEQALDWALYGGEDFELVLCAEASVAERLIQELGEDLISIGVITPEPEVRLVHQGQAHSLELTKGFGHFNSYQ
jgi:thiamine-monophosphate kinase